MEECAEVAQRASKALRFGLDEVQQGKDLSNEQLIVEELRDLEVTRLMLEEDGLDFRWLSDVGFSQAKRSKILRWMEYSRERGKLE